MADKRRRARTPKEKKAYGAAYYQRNKERINASAKAKINANPEARRAYLNRHRELHREHYRVQKLAKAFGITKYAAAEILKQEHCAICGAPATDTDHNHATGAIRERLCTNCNNGLGWFADDSGRLRVAAAYIEKHAAMPRKIICTNP